MVSSTIEAAFVSGTQETFTLALQGQPPQPGMELVATVVRRHTSGAREVSFYFNRSVSGPKPTRLNPRPDSGNRFTTFPDYDGSVDLYVCFTVDINTAVLAPWCAFYKGPVVGRRDGDGPYPEDCAPEG